MMRCGLSAAWSRRHVLAGQGGGGDDQGHRDVSGAVAHLDVPSPSWFPGSMILAGPRRLLTKSARVGFLTLSVNIKMVRRSIVGAESGACKLCLCEFGRGIQ